MAERVTEEYISPFYDLLQQSDDGYYYVEDEENGLYEIEAFLGDVSSICQVFRAKYYTGSKKAELHGEIRVDNHQVVALKLAREDDSDEFMNMRQEAENSFTIGPSDDQENDVITANNIIVGLYKLFFYREIMCVSMPYMKEGSIRYNINRRIPDRKLPEKCIAVVLRQTLRGLCFLHGLGKVHTKLNAGNIFVDDFDSPVAIKLAYMGSNYFHNPDVDYSWEPKHIQKPEITYCCGVSNLPENLFWATRGIYEPSSNEENNHTPASDIWNLGVTALELALGPLLTYQGQMRTPAELRAFLTQLQKYEDLGVPDLYDLFIGYPATITTEEELFKLIGKKTTSTSTSSITATARKKRKGLLNAGKKVKIFVKKVKAKIRGRKLGADGPELNPDVQVGPSNLFKEMVRRCLLLDPDERPKAEILINDPFFVKHQDAGMQYFANVIRPAA